MPSDPITCWLILIGVFLVMVIISIFGISWDMDKRDMDIYFLRKEIELLKRINKRK